jgi:uncharacterized protein YkwD
METGFNFIDFLLVAIVLLSVWSGWRKGFIIGALELVTWIGSFVAALAFYKYPAALLEKYFSFGVWTLPVAFVLVLILMRILFGVLIRKVLHITPIETHAHGINKILGVVPGFLSGIIYATIAAALLLATPIFATFSEKARESKIANELAVHVEWIDEKFSPVFDEAVNRSLNNLTVNPKSTETVKLPFTVQNPKLREDLEAKMLELVNEERAKEGLPPLKADPEMAEIARKHSRDMFAKGYFAHVNLEGETPTDRIRKARVRYLTAGENLALAPTLKLAHNGLMNSPGHRANILHKSYGRLGIGILDGGYRGLMVTQNFRN